MGKQQALRTPSQVTLPDSLAKSAYEEMYVGTFWSTYLPQGEEFPAQIAQYTNGVWTRALPEFYLKSSIIRKALLAVGLTIAGIAYKKQPEREDGLRLYVNSLQDMSIALTNPKRQNQLTLCIASRLFGLYEVRCFQPLAPAIDFSSFLCVY
jgi:hypothetical protein